MATTTPVSPSVAGVSRWLWLLLFLFAPLPFLVPYVNEKQEEAERARMAAVSASSAEAARPKDYAELSLGDERLKKFQIELRGSKRNSGLFVLDRRATDFRLETTPHVGLDFIEYPSGKRTFLAPGEHPPNDSCKLWDKVAPDGRKQFFSIEAKGDCTVTFTVSAR